MKYTTQYIANGELQVEAQLLPADIQKVTAYIKKLMDTVPAGMTKSAVRNMSKEMSQDYRMMYITYNDKPWTTDGYVAMAGDHYKPTRKSVRIEEKPETRLDAIVPDFSQYSKVLNIERDDADEPNEYGYKQRYKLTGGRSTHVQVRYHDAIIGVYPNAMVYKKQSDPLAPIIYRVDGQTVAVLMPLKK